MASFLISRFGSGEAMWSLGSLIQILFYLDMLKSCTCRCVTAFFALGYSFGFTLLPLPHDSPLSILRKLHCDHIATWGNRTFQECA